MCAGSSIPGTPTGFPPVAARPPCRMRQCLLRSVSPEYPGIPGIPRNTRVKTSTETAEMAMMRPGFFDFVALTRGNSRHLCLALRRQGTFTSSADPAHALRPSRLVRCIRSDFLPRLGNGGCPVAPIRPSHSGATGPFRHLVPSARSLHLSWRSGLPSHSRSLLASEVS